MNVIRRTATISIRAILSITYLWVVADRLGILGEIGNPGVVWGDFETFLDYTHSLNPWFPRQFSDLLGYLVTIIEIVLAIGLIIGTKLKYVALGSLSLLLIFILSMFFALGLNNSFEFIIFTTVLAILSALIIWDESKSNL